MMSAVGLAQQKPIPFGQLDTPPIFKDCHSVQESDAVQCTVDAIETFTKKKFNTGLFKNLNLNEKRIRVYAQFIITKHGEITSIAVRTAYPRLEQETKRVLLLAPRFTPGKQGDTLVDTLYVLPLVFTLG